MGSTCRHCRSQWPHGLRRRSAAAPLLRLWVRIPPGAWMFVCCECCVLSGRGLCNELITRPEESYRLWCVVVCDLETSWMRRPWPTGGCCAKKNKRKDRPYLKPFLWKPINQFLINLCLLNSFLRNLILNLMNILWKVFSLTLGPDLTDGLGFYMKEFFLSSYRKYKSDINV